MKIKIPKFFKKKRNIWIIVILLVVVFLGWLIFGRGKSNGAIQIGTAEKQNLQETVLATGQVVSSTDLILNFQGAGTVAYVGVKEGDKVYAGKLLATLNESSARATLTTAQGSLAQAKANYDKLIAGATPQNIKVSQSTVDSAKQDLKNAYDGAIATLNSAYATMYTAYTVVDSVQNTYFSTSDQQGIAVSNGKNDIKISMEDAKKYIDSGDTDTAISKMILNLNNVYNDLVLIRTQCDQGVYYYNVSDTNKTSLNTQKTAVNTALSNVNTLQQTIASLKIALQKAEDQLSVTTAPPTQADIDASKAAVLSAQGQVDAALATLRNMEIIAPSEGTITQVNIKVGEQANSTTQAIALQDINNLHAEADVSEANIAALQIDQTIDYTFDALGPDEHFTGKVLTINPASTVVSGVVNYLVKGSFDNVPGLKPGMTANMTILVAKKDNVLAVPSTSIINKNNKQYVRVVDDEKKKTYHEVEIKTGLQADGGMVEILSGLSDGEKIITYMP